MKRKSYTLKATYRNIQKLRLNEGFSDIFDSEGGTLKTEEELRKEREEELESDLMMFCTRLVRKYISQPTRVRVPYISPETGEPVWRNGKQVSYEIWRQTIDYQGLALVLNNIARNMGLNNGMLKFLFEPKTDTDPAWFGLVSLKSSEPDYLCGKELEDGKLIYNFKNAVAVPEVTRVVGTICMMFFNDEDFGLGAQDSIRITKSIIKTLKEYI